MSILVCMATNLLIKIHQKFLRHEKIENLVGLEVELIYEWDVGSMLILIGQIFIVHHQLLKVKKLV